MRRLKRNALWHLCGVLWRNAEGVRPLVIMYASMAMCAVLVGLIAPLVTARLLNDVQQLHGTELLNRSAWRLGTLAFLGLMFWAFHGPSRVLEQVLAFRARRVFQAQLLKKVTALPTRWHRSHHSGETIDQVSKATTALADFASCGFEVIHILTRFIGAVVLLTWYMPLAGILVVAIGLLAGVIISLFDRSLTAQYQALNKRFHFVAAGIQDYLTNVATVISLRLEQRVNAELDERMALIVPQIRRNALTVEMKWFTTSRFVDVVHAGVLFVYIAIAVRSERALEIGTVYALSEYLRSIGESFFQFAGRYGELMVQSTRVRCIDHIESDYDREVRATAEATLPQGWRRIAIRGLTFSHGAVGDDEAVTHISGVDLQLERGRSYALVGESGSGKSTVLGLLRGIHRADRAQVLCDGAVMPHGLSHVAHHSTLIPQDPEIFADTVRFNVTMGVEAREGEIARAISLARFEQVAERLPKGVETNIAEKGVSLSGGEKQRLALARGIFFAEESDSQIVLMDEPTSSVDIFNERLIYEAVLAHFADRCVLSAIHKFHLLHLFDEVLVFAGGRLVERGTLEQLRASKGEFNRLWRNFHQEDEDNVKVIA